MSPSSIEHPMPVPGFHGFCLLCAAVVIGHATHISVVYPVVLESRSADGTTTIKINEHIIVNLAPSEVFSSRFVLSTATQKNLTHEEFDPSYIAKHIYQDEYTMTAVSMQDVNGAVKLNGIINGTYGIEPLPVLAHNEDGRIPHRLFRQTNILGGGHAGVTSRSFENAKQRKKFQRFSNAATPEVYFFCDTTFSKNFKTDKDIINYVAVLLAAVNLRYRSIRGYEIIFKFVGMTRLTPELEEDFMVMYGKYMNGQSTLLMLMMFSRRMGVQEADVRYLLTARDLIAPHKGRMDATMAGLAYVGGICSLDGVAIGEDKPGLYSGVNIMTHELAHSLGCVHDGEDPPANIPGHQGSNSPECASRNGYIMSYHNDDSPNRFRFSPCCQAQIKLLLRLVSDECIMNTFKVTQSSPQNGFLPGHWLSPYDFCKKKQPQLMLASLRSIKADEKCKLKCEYTTGSYKTALLYDALDGTECGQWKRCSSGVCT